MIIVFGAIAFLFYRIITAGMFDFPLSIVACMIGALLSALIMQVFTGVMAARLGKLAFERTMKNGQESVFEVTLLPLVACIAANFVQLYLIALGFSDQFFDELAIGYRESFYETNLFWFFMVSATPIVSYATFFLSRLRIAPLVRVPTDEVAKRPRRKGLDL